MLKEENSKPTDAGTDKKEGETQITFNNDSEESKQLHNNDTNELSMKSMKTIGTTPSFSSSNSLYLPFY